MEVHSIAAIDYKDRRQDDALESLVRFDLQEKDGITTVRLTPVATQNPPPVATSKSPT